MAKKAVNTAESSASSSSSPRKAAPRARKHVKSQAVAVAAAVEEFVSVMVHPKVAEEAVTPEPKHEDVSRLAYRFYLERGGQNGSPADDWFRAEHTLRG